MIRRTLLLALASRRHPDDAMKRSMIDEMVDEI
jgi:hypothetical protein